MVTFLGLLQVVSVFLEGRLLESGGGPEVGGEVAVGFEEGLVGGLDEVTQGAGRTAGAGVHILDTSHLEDLLGGTSSDDTSTTGGGDQAEADGTTGAGDLRGDGVGSTEAGTPVATTDRDNSKLGGNDGTADSQSNFLGAFDAQTNVTVLVTDDNESLEAGALTSAGLLLNRGDLHDLILEGLTEEVLDDLVLLDGHGEQVDVLKRLDLSSLYQTAKLGDGDPLALVVTTATASTASTSAVSTTTATATAASTESTTESSFFCHTRFATKWEKGVNNNLTMM